LLGCWACGSSSRADSAARQGQAPVGMDSIQVTTYFETQTPPGENAPVCLTNRLDPVGKVQNVRPVPEHTQYHDRWEVGMGIPNPTSGDFGTVNQQVQITAPDPYQ
jgi:hypothetical protein